MTTTRVYSGGTPPPLAPRHVLALLGRGPHVQQCQVLVRATSKRAAWDALDAAGFYLAKSAVELARGAVSDALVEHVTEHTPILAHNMRGAGPVVFVSYIKDWARIIGHLESGETPGDPYAFIPERSTP